MTIEFTVIVACGFLILGAQWWEDWQRRRAALVLKRGCDPVAR